MLEDYVGALLSLCWSASTGTMMQRTDRRRICTTTRSSSRFRGDSCEWAISCKWPRSSSFQPTCWSWLQAMRMECATSRHPTWMGNSRSRNRSKTSESATWRPKAQSAWFRNSSIPAHSKMSLVTWSAIGQTTKSTSSRDSPRSTRSKSRSSCFPPTCSLEEPNSRIPSGS